MNDADKMRELEKSSHDYGLQGKPLAFREGFSKDFNEAWQAATAQQAELIQELWLRLAVTEKALELASREIAELETQLDNEIESSKYGS